jgi:hypothetical protein
VRQACIRSTGERWNALCLDTLRAAEPLRTKNSPTNKADVGSTWMERKTLACSWSSCTTLRRHMGVKLPSACNVPGVVTAHGMKLLKGDAVGVRVFALERMTGEWGQPTSHKRLDSRSGLQSTSFKSRRLSLLVQLRLSL